MRRGAYLQLVVFSLIAGAAGLALALGPAWLPDAASKEAGRIHFVFWFTIGICIFIFALVAAVMTYTIIHFRVDPEDDSDGPPIHGHTGLEIVWTAIPTVLVVAIGIVSAVVLARNDNVGPHPFRVHVTAQQFAWSFSYPEADNLTAAVLRLPVNTSVELELQTKDVIHSFWVPEFSQKQDIVPGLTTKLHITPTKIGTYNVICTELCGLGHSVMRSEAIVMSKPAFKRWLARQKQTTSAPQSGGVGGTSGQGGTAGGGNAAPANTQKLGALVFANNQCGACHTFKPAGASATTGPDLDKLAQYAQQAKQPLAAFVHESIVNPNAYVQPGYPKNVMPPTFSSLPKRQLDALVQYLIARKG